MIVCLYENLFEFDGFEVLESVIRAYSSEICLSYMNLYKILIGISC